MLAPYKRTGASLFIRYGGFASLQSASYYQGVPMMHIFNLKRLFAVLLPTIYLLGVLGILASGGSDSDDDSDGGDVVSYPTPELPANALVLDINNAKPIGQQAVELTGVLSDIAEFKSDQQMTLPQIIQVALDPMIDGHRIRPAVAAKTVTEDLSDELCVSGTATTTYDETDDSASGSFTYINCDLGGDIILNGEINADGSYSETTMDYFLQFGGSLAITGGGESLSIVMNFKTSGNDGTGDFSIDASYSLDTSQGGGFLITTEVPVTGNGFSGDFSAGKLVVQGGTGASGATRLEIVVDPPSMADITLFEGSNSTFIDKIPLS